ncbi:MAG: [Fe-Fe] hydrogenase large subunit C-terminal domain-containing protein, partial [Planctomycetota bacterium]
FPASFTDMTAGQFLGAVRALGFAYVNEVAFGADLVAERYRTLMAEPGERHYISTPCPAIISFVEKYHPGLIGALAPIVSPMVAIARALHRLHGEGLRVVFIGPCIAKKREAASTNVPGEVDAALTFAELRVMFEEAGLEPEGVGASDFDPPRAGLGALFPLSRGLLQAADIQEDLMAGEVVATDGRTNFVEGIKEFESGALDARLLEVLACTGCIMGAGMTCDQPLFGRRSRVAAYVRETMARFDRDRWEADMARFADLDLSRGYTANDKRVPPPSEADLREILERMGKHEPADELNCGACGYETCREHAIAIYKGLAESEMCLPATIGQLHDTIAQLTDSNQRLASVQEALLHAEKLASMGQLAAGIAHEINNPLGVVLLYAHLLLDEAAQREDLPREDLQMIVEQADRCKKIVAGLLNFARQQRTVLQPADLRELVEHTIEMLHVPDGIEIRIEQTTDDAVAEVDHDQIAQVFTNLITNAQAAMPDGGSLTVGLGGDEDRVVVTVADTGCGIPEEHQSKIFEPFFTTKQIGKGTGLGLAVTYGIVKMHRGDITFDSNADPDDGPTGTTFKVTLPRKGQE